MTNHDLKVQVDNALEDSILESIMCYGLSSALQRVRELLANGVIHDPTVKQAYIDFSERHKGV